MNYVDCVFLTGIIACLGILWAGVGLVFRGLATDLAANSAYDDIGEVVQRALERHNLAR